MEIPVKISLILIFRFLNFYHLHLLTHIADDDVTK